jgi:hypothetical protein
MKRKFLMLGTLLLMTFIVNSCEILSGCKVCKQVYYLDGNFDHEGDEVQYCDAELLRVQTAGSQLIGIYNVEYECR